MSNERRPPTTTLDERLAARRTTLSPAGQEVADFFARHREEVAFLSATAIARRLGTSDATVIRTAQSLGYAGLQELKRECADTLRSRTASGIGNPPEETCFSPEAALDHALTAQIGLLEEVRRTVPQEAFARALGILHAAERVLVFGIGPAAAAADYLVRGLIRIGRQATASTCAGSDRADTLLTLRPGDALVMVACGERAREVAVALDRATMRGLPVALLADTPDAALVERVTVSLPLPHCYSRPDGSVATMLVVMDALLIGLEAHDPARARAATADLNDLRARIVGSNE